MCVDPRSGVCRTVIASPPSGLLEVCHTQGSVRLALIPLLFFLLGPIPFLYKFVSIEKGWEEARAFVVKRGGQHDDDPLENDTEALVRRPNGESLAVSTVLTLLDDDDEGTEMHNVQFADA